MVSGHCPAPIMFRHATEGTLKPCWLMVCDHPSCNVVARMDVPAGVDPDAVKLEFIRQMVENDWWVVIGEQLCHLHSQVRKSAAEARRLVRVAKTMPHMSA